MRLSQLIYFKKITECGTISEAANDLSISAPAVSIAISNLEKELGVKLFERSGNRLILTQAGGVYLKRIDQILRDLIQANQEIRQFSPNSSEATSDESVLLLRSRRKKN